MDKIDLTAPASPADASAKISGTSATVVIDAAIKQGSAYRGTLGAAQNRREHTINDLSVIQENLAASESQSVTPTWRR